MRGTIGANFEQGWCHCSWRIINEGCCNWIVSIQANVGECSIELRSHLNRHVKFDRRFVPHTVNDKKGNTRTLVRLYLVAAAAVKYFYVIERYMRKRPYLLNCLNSTRTIYVVSRFSVYLEVATVSELNKLQPTYFRRRPLPSPRAFGLSDTLLTAVTSHNFFIFLRFSSLLHGAPLQLRKVEYFIFERMREQRAAGSCDSRVFISFSDVCSITRVPLGSFNATCTLANSIRLWYMYIFFFFTISLQKNMETS